MSYSNPICGIYKITNPKECIYIGQSLNCQHRLSYYRNLFCISQKRLYNSIKKYGWDAHTFEIIDVCLPDDLNDKEIYYIELFQCFGTKHGLNLRSGGNRPVWSKESREKASISAIRRGVPKTTIDNLIHLNKTRKRKPASEKVKNTLSKMRLGNPPWNKGKGMSKDEKKIMKKIYADRYNKKLQILLKTK